MATKTRSSHEQFDVDDVVASRPVRGDLRVPPVTGEAGVYLGAVLPGLPGGGPLERPELSDELIDALLGDRSSAREIAGPEGLLGELTRRLLERALEAEITEHLGYRAGSAPLGGAGNSRNGRPAKTVLTDQGAVRSRSPRATATGRLSRRSSASARRGGSASTRRSSRSTRGASRRGRSRAISLRSTAPRSA